MIKLRKLLLSAIYLVVILSFLNINAQSKTILVSGLTGEGSEISPQWEPGGSRMAFLKANKLLVYNQTTGQPPKPVTLDGREDTEPLSFAWNPSGGHKFAALITEKRGRLGLYLGKDYQLTQRLVEFSQGGEGVQFSKLSWSPDGQEVIYADNGILYKIPTVGAIKPERLIPEGILSPKAGAESWGMPNPQDADIIAFQLESNGQEAVYIYYRREKKIIGKMEGNFSACHPAWSPDGKCLAFFISTSSKDKDAKGASITWGLAYAAYDSARKEIGPLRELAAGDSIRRKAPYADFTTICWTPDSRKLIYARYGKENENKLTIADLPEGKISKLDLGGKIEVDTSQGHTTSWNMRLIYSDVSCTCIDGGRCWLAFAADMDLGESVSRIAVVNLGD